MRKSLPFVGLRPVLWLALTLCVFGRDDHFNQFFDDWRWVRFNTASGLPSNSVLTMVEDSEEITWVGTEEGVAWFDGYSWHPVGASAGLPCHEAVRRLWTLGDGKVALDCSGYFYVGGRGGFSKINLSTTGSQREPVLSAAPLNFETLLLQTGRELLLYANGKITAAQQVIQK